MSSRFRVHNYTKGIGHPCRIGAVFEAETEKEV